MTSDTPSDIKVVACGDHVGKTHLIWGIDQVFNYGRVIGDILPYYAHAVVQTCYYPITIRKDPFALEICDTHCYPEMAPIRTPTYLSTDVFLVCFSIDIYKSYESITSRWIPELSDRGQLLVPRILVGLNQDTRVRAIFEGKPRISWSQGIDLAKKTKAFSYVEVDLVRGCGVTELLDEVCAVHHCIHKHDHKRCTIQ
mmetsp:Transcript_26245/g.29219  ORF Transcript_26245/g.29219 Transcript_26245/m.29219 type:complete len:198 (-) Transcript_26245:29-622(-)